MMNNKIKAATLLLTASMLSCITDDPEPSSPTPNGRPTVTVTTVAGQYIEEGTGGFADGKGQQAQFRYPGQMVFDKYDNLYIIDQGMLHEKATVIRKIDPAGNVTTFASGFTSLSDICIDPRDGITLYAVDNDYYSETKVNAIYRISASEGAVLLAGGPDRVGYQDGNLQEAMFRSPSGCVMDETGHLYIADALNYCVRKIDLDAGVVTTLAGHPFDPFSESCQFADGQGSAAEFCNFIDLAIDGDGNIMVPDRYNHRIRKITSSGVVTTLIASAGGVELDGPLAEATTAYPLLTYYDPQSQHLFMSSNSGGRLRVATAKGHVLSLAGHYGSTFGHGYQDGNGEEAKFNGINGVAVNSKGEIFLADNVNHCIRKVTLQWN